LKPKKDRGIDFSRVRECFLSGNEDIDDITNSNNISTNDLTDNTKKPHHFRQLIVTSQFQDANVNSTFKNFASSHSGQLKLKQKIDKEEAAITDVMVSVRQVFQVSERAERGGGLRKTRNIRATTELTLFHSITFVWLARRSK